MDTAGSVSTPAKLKGEETVVLNLFQCARDYIWPGKLKRTAFCLWKVRREFRKQGWNLESTHYQREDVVFRHPKFGLVLVWMIPFETMSVNVFDASDRAAARMARLVILTNPPCPLAVKQEALARMIVVLEWPDISQLAFHLETLHDQRLAVLAAAKQSERAAAPGAAETLSRPLTPAQEQNGFIFNTSRVACWFSDRGGEVLLIAFAPLGTDFGLGRRWGETFGLSGNSSTLGFETSSLNWYPDDHTRECIAAAERVIGQRFSARILFGVGQGGYAALRYSLLLHATTVLAISPVFSIDPDIIRDNRFRHSYITQIHSGMHISRREAAGRTFIIYDPYDPNDKVHAERIRAETGANLIRRPFSGHGCRSLLSNTGAITQLLRQAQDGQAIQIARIAATQRHNGIDRPFLMALNLATTRPSVAYSLFQKYSPRSPNLAWGDVCYRLAQHGYAEKMLPWAMERADALSSEAEPQALVALVALCINRFDTAQKYIALALEHEPRSERFLHIRSLAHA